MLSLVLALLAWLFFAFCYQGHLVYNQGLCLFLDTKEYFIDKVSHIGGLGDYIAIFLTQFNYWPLLGAAIIAVILGGIHFLLTLYIKKNGFARIWSQIALAVPFVLWILLCRKGELVTLPFGVLVAVAFSLMRLGNKKTSGLWLIILAAVLYFGFGLFPSLTFFLLQVISYIPVKGEGLRSKKGLGFAVAAAIFVAGGFGVYKSADIGLEMDMRYTQAARNRDWTELIKYSQDKRLKRSAAMCNCVNLALANTIGGEGKSLLNSYALYSKEV